MNAFQYNAILPLIFAGLYVVLLIYAMIRRGQARQNSQWIFIVLFVTLIWEFSLFFTHETPNALTPHLILIGSAFAVGIATAIYADWRPHLLWLVAGLVAAGGTVALALLQPDRFYTVSSIAVRQSNLLILLVWIALNGLIIAQTTRAYRRTRFPWHANRLLFWTMACYAIFLGEAIHLFQNPITAVFGQTLRWSGLSAMTYALSSYRILDVRTQARRIVAFLLINVVSALPLIGIIIGIQQLGSQLQELQLITLIGVVIFIGFFLYQPFRNFIEKITYRYIVGEDVNTSQVVREYSQAISKTLDMEQLSLLIMTTLSELLDTNRGALFLLTRHENGRFEVEPIPALGRLSRKAYTFPPHNRFIAALQEKRQPLLQYDIDFDPEFASLDEESQAWLKNQTMEAFIPVSSGNELIGLIAIGPKNSSVPYQTSELELVQILADQTVVALQNARLYSELGNQNAHIRELNRSLVDQNERLEIMDKVKSDFITIASHELRTPLTQVKGYTDILAAMNEENALTRDQTREIVGHVNRATLQLESLITAMLDASQLDVDGMQLTFVKTQLDTIIRLAIEPLVQATRERQITLKLVGIEELPHIYADFKRLVQCFTNIIGNAVKYTPDHGTIVVESVLVPAAEEQEDFIEVTIKDSGIGIDPKFHELIFEKFFRIGDPQLHSTGSTKFKGAGPGLGLPIAKGVIEAHGGRIWVESEGEDEKKLPGSKFHVILPVKPAGVVVDDELSSESRPAYLIG